MLVTVAKLKSADVVAICLPCNVTFDVHDMRIVIANIWSQSLRDYIVTINDNMLFYDMLVYCLSIHFRNVEIVIGKRECCFVLYILSACISIYKLLNFVLKL